MLEAWNQSTLLLFFFTIDIQSVFLLITPNIYIEQDLCLLLCGLNKSNATPSVASALQNATR